MTPQTDCPASSAARPMGLDPDQIRSRLFSDMASVEAYAGIPPVTAALAR